MSATRVVTRFAPSPTGYMHIGNLRTALYAYLLARHHGGTFILRIEDTDRQRLVADATKVILDTLRITGLSYDEGPGVGGPHGPYVQSERLDIYRRYALELIEKGAAYYCFCAKERQEEPEPGEALGGGYDRHCRYLSKEEVEARLAAGMPYVIRQKMPLDGTTVFYDEVFGEIATENKELQDQVLLKADGYPTYNFCHVVDDYLMGVTHVLRGTEYLTSTPKYALLYDSFGWPRPHYVHLPLMMGRNGDGSVSKLSKRHGSVSFADLLADGFLPQAILNYIALLGWCPKDSQTEFYSLAELAELFTVDGISKSPSVFDFDKLLWFNGEYIRRLPFPEFAQAIKPFLRTPLPDFVDLDRALALLHGRLDKLSLIDEKMAFFVQVPPYETALFCNKKNKVTEEQARGYLAAALPVLEGLTEWEGAALYQAMTELAARLDCKPAALLWCLRIAVSGLLVTPGGATEIMAVIGRDESLLRVRAALDKLS
ncbi:MAG: glutamate--tRNA ligase [Eubacteriales bacterium]